MDQDKRKADVKKNKRIMLATYQPLQILKNGKIRDEAINPGLGADISDLDMWDTILWGMHERKGTQEFGFQPIWCFSADSPEEFFAGSHLAAPTMPTGLFLFFSDKYIIIDKVKHYQNVAIDGTLRLNEVIATNSLNKKYAEYVVSSQEFHDSFNSFGSYYQAGYMLNYAEKYLNDMRDLFSHFCQVPQGFWNEMQSRIIRLKDEFMNQIQDPDPDKNYDLAKCTKFVFEATILPLICEMIFGGNKFVEGVYARHLQMDWPQAKKIWDAAEEWKANGAKTGSYEDYDKLYNWLVRFVP